MRDLLAELTQALNRGQQIVFCSVVETRGSTPQKAGAAMLVHADGTQSGTLGGGCVEAEVKRRALQVLNEPAGVAEILSFTLDDDYGWDDGLICGGRMTMLMDPLRNSEFGIRNRRVLNTRNLAHRSPVAYYSKYRELVEASAGCTEVVALQASSLRPGSRYLFDSSAILVGQLAEVSPSRELLELLRPLVERPLPSVKSGFAFLPVLPRITLLIVGGGHVGQAVADLASRVDFDIWVLDDREKYASSERFPTAQKRLVGDIGNALRDLVARDIHPGFYCLIVTRGHNHDEEALFHLARSNAGYVGMIGSKRKIKLIREDLIVKGVSEEALAKIHAPLGLPIGSQTVPEIAISIVAELIQCRNTGGIVRGGTEKAEKSRIE